MPNMDVPWLVQRKLLVKTEERTDPDYGCRPDERPILQLLKYGLINLDKPAGPTSHEVAAWVKRILQLRRVGHGGTLETRVREILT